MNTVWEPLFCPVWRSGNGKNGAVRSVPTRESGARRRQKVEQLMDQVGSAALRFRSGAGRSNSEELLMELGEVIENAALLAAYLEFDLEATKRENESLRSVIKRMHE